MFDFHIHLNIQGDSGGVTATYGAHFRRHFEQKVSYKSGSYTQYLQSYVRNWNFSKFSILILITKLHHLNAFIVTKTN
jgi:hypothetical protein